MGTNKRQIVQRICISILFLCCLFAWSDTAGAESVTDWIQNDEQDIKEEPSEEPAQVEPIENQDPSFLWSLVKLVFILALMLGLLYAGVRFFSRRNRQMRDLNVLENLGGIPVGQQKSVQLIRVGNAYYLLGVGDNVELLTEIEDESMIHELTQLADNPEEEGLFSAFQRNKQEKTKSDQSSSFKQLYTKELNNLMNSRKEMIESQQKREDNE